MTIRFASALVVGILVAFIARPAAATTFYHLVDLGPGTATAISQSGDAAGYVGNDAAYWSGGTMHDLGPGRAFGINDSDQVVGQMGSTNPGLSHAFLYSNGTMQNLGVLPGGSYSYATAINDAGQVAGTSGIAFGDVSAFYYDGAMQGLGTNGNESGSSFAYAINDSGIVVGQANSLAGYGHAFMWTKARGLHDLGTINGFIRDTSEALAISNNGLIVGQSSPGHAFSTMGNGNGLSDLGPGSAYGVNDAGQILGVNVAIALDNSGAGWSSVSAAAINNNGWIAGSAVFGGVSHAVLFVPGVPEPSSLVLSVIAMLFAGVGWRRLRPAVS
jgi:probable HAF family extracellular repeat protein